MQRIPFFRRFLPAVAALAMGLTLALSAHDALAATVPQAASAAGREMDRQIASRAAGGKSISLCITTPMDVNDLTVANPLARQMQEEVARWFVQAGYQVVEIRKGRDLLFEPLTGEMLLTREDKLLGSRSVTSTAIVAGTYTVTPENVRFNIRVVRTKTREVLGMSTVTIPIDREVAALLHSTHAYGGTPIEPTVVTLLP